VAASIAFACFVSGIIAFVRFFYLALLLRKERVGEPESKLHDWCPWLPGRFTAAGMRIRRQMNVLLVVGWILLLVGLALQPR
jgi:hypothetical protein